jgi:murein DD-endopeptidase MepM/ murein hydrolase activator NlpD
MELPRYVMFLALLLPLGLLSFFPSPPPDETEPTASAVTSPSDEVVSSTLEEPRDAFGLPSHQFKTVEERVQRRETFSDMLNEHNVSYQRIVALAEASRDVYDVRRIVAGRPYRVYVNEWLQEAAFIVYRPTATQYVVYDIQHPERSYVGQRSVSVSWDTASGIITSSLYQTLTAQGAHPGLALRLSEVFAWQVDFFRIQRGDRFRVVYEKRHLGDTELPPGDIIAARFEHEGRDYYAFRFDAPNQRSYFDEKGNSMRRQLLKSPLRYRRISSHFSRSRLHPVTGQRRAHLGTDYAAPTGTPVRTVGDGVVLVASYDRSNGYWVKIRHNSTYTTGYLHLSRFAKGVRPGKRVKQGDVIGYVGSTGLSTGPHLHYHFWKHGVPIDARSVDLPPSEPVYPQYRSAFNAMVADMRPQLEWSQPSPLRVAATRDSALLTLF